MPMAFSLALGINPFDHLMDVASPTGLLLQVVIINSSR